MKQGIALLLVLTCYYPAAFGQPKGGKAVAQAKKIRAYGPPVKLDISGNECLKRTDEAYVHSLFYEEFKTLSECREALSRRS